MEIQNLPLSDIRPYENNPRKNDDAVKYVAASIREFGFKVPIIIDKEGTIIAGHTRYKAAQELGMTEMPCICADDLTDEQVKAFRLADNKVGEIADWDMNLLMQELEDIDIDMEAFGFLDEQEKEKQEEPDIDINVKYEILITCRSEEELQATYEKLTQDGLECQILA